MSRFPQPAGARGSLKWIQRAVNRRPDALDPLILKDLAGATAIDWRSPLASDDHAEYRDAAFLGRLGLAHLNAALADFWPARGPQWDALARTDRGDILLIEAKAHVAELCSPGSQAGTTSRSRIAATLAGVARELGAAPRAPWTDLFYQLANRIAYLHFLRSHGEQAWLVLVNFVGDTDMQGPSSAAEWRAAYQVAWNVMGLAGRHATAKHILHVYPEVALLGD